MINYEKKYIELCTGEKYAYLEKGQGKDVILLIHGNMSSSLFFYELMERIPNKYHVFAPDIRGFGDSSYNSSFSSFDEIADDLICFCKKLGIAKCYLLGWSAGGGMSLKLAAKAPELVKKLILVEGASYRGFPVYRKNKLGLSIIGEVYFSKEEMALDPVLVAPALQAQIDGNWQFFKTIYGYTIFNVKKPSEEDYDILMKEAVKQRCLVDLDWSLASLNMSSFSNIYSQGTDDIANVTCPVLSIWGNKDLVVKEYMVDETVKALANAKCIKLDGVSHSPLTDIPDEFAKIVLDFCQE